MGRLLPWLVLAGAVCAVTANVLRLRSDVSLAGPSLTAQVLEVMAGGALIITGGAARPRQHRLLLVGAGACWLMAEWASPAAPGALAFTAGLVVAGGTLPLAIATRDWHPRAAWALSLSLAVASAVLIGPLTAAAVSPRETGCALCSPDLVAMIHDATLATRFTRLGLQLTLATGLSVAVWLAFSLVRSDLFRRRHLRLKHAADVAVCLFVVSATGDAAASLRGGVLSSTSVHWRALSSVALLGLAAAVGATTWRAARAIRVVAQATAAITDGADTSAAEVLQSGLGDPGLRVVYPTPEGGWRTHEGQSAIVPAVDVTLVTDAGATVAALIHSRGAPVDADTVTRAAAAARLLLDTERIEADSSARVEELRVSGLYAVEAGDDARSRLEQDLHDGAQQHLVLLRFAIGLARSRASRWSNGVVTENLTRADLAAEHALNDLRDLAHGFSTTALDVDGLAGAVRMATERAAVAVTIVALPPIRLPETVERATYQLVSRCIREADRCHAATMTITTRLVDNTIAVEIGINLVTDLSEWPTADVANRWVAAGGTLHHDDDGDGSRLIASLPCG